MEYSTKEISISPTFLTTNTMACNRVCNPWKACDNHAERHAASPMHPRRGGEEEVKERVELVMNEVAGADEDRGCTGEF